MICSIAYSNVRSGPLGRPDNLFESYLGKFRESLDQMSSRSLSNIRGFRAELKLLIAEKMDY